MKLTRPFAALLLVALCACTNTNNYYFDSVNGSDSNSGRSPKKAWKTLAMAETLQLQPGDSILFRRGSTFEGQVTFTGVGTEDARITVDAYGEGELPVIVAPDTALFTVKVLNCDYFTIKHLDITNSTKDRLAKRCGLDLCSFDGHVSHDIRVESNYIHDIYGTLVKGKGEGCGIDMKCTTESYFDGLLIENNIIRRTSRNGIKTSTYEGQKANRLKWHPSLGVIIRKNLLEEVPGDGIVPIGCDGAIIEYNLMRKCGADLPYNDAAAGIWPWSCDNTVIQFNEVSDHMATRDGQGYDSDYNCENTVIQYNYSHDNFGGFCLLCCPGDGQNPPQKPNVGNENSLIQYNVSINDGFRPKDIPAEQVCPAIQIAGGSHHSKIYRNFLYSQAKPDTIDHCMIASQSWNGYSDDTVFQENLFYSEDGSSFRFSKSTNDVFERNYYLGSFLNKPEDPKGIADNGNYRKMFEDFDYNTLLKTVTIADGAAQMQTVDKEAVEMFFDYIASL